MRYLIIAPLLLLGGCHLLQGGDGLQKAIDVVMNSDLEPGTKQVIIDAMREAFQGGGIRGVLGDVADGAVALVLGYFGIKHAPKLFGRKKDAATPPQ